MIDSARMLRAELPVHKNNTLYAFSTMARSGPFEKKCAHDGHAQQEVAGLADGSQQVSFSVDFKGTQHVLDLGVISVSSP